MKEGPGLKKNEREKNNEGVKKRNSGPIPQTNFPTSHIPLSKKEKVGSNHVPQKNSVVFIIFSFHSLKMCWNGILFTFKWKANFSFHFLFAFPETVWGTKFATWKGSSGNRKWKFFCGIGDRVDFLQILLTKLLFIYFKCFHSNIKYIYIIDLNFRILDFIF